MTGKRRRGIRKTPGAGRRRIPGGRLRPGMKIQTKRTFPEQPGRNRPAGIRLTAWVNPKLRKNTEEQKQGENFKKKYDSISFPSRRPEPPVRKPKKSYGLLKKFGLCAALAVVFGLISGLIILGSLLWDGRKRRFRCARRCRPRSRCSRRTRKRRRLRSVRC